MERTVICETIRLSTVLEMGITCRDISEKLLNCRTFWRDFFSPFDTKPLIFNLEAGSSCSGMNAKGGPAVYKKTTPPACLCFFEQSGLPLNGS
jgi:hypothetical protein